MSFSEGLAGAHERRAAAKTEEGVAAEEQRTRDFYDEHRGPLEDAIQQWFATMGAPPVPVRYDSVATRWFYAVGDQDKRESHDVQASWVIEGHFYLAAPGGNGHRFFVRGPSERASVPGPDTDVWRWADTPEALGAALVPDPTKLPRGLRIMMTDETRAALVAWYVQAGQLPPPDTADV